MNGGVGALEAFGSRVRDGAARLLLRLGLTPNFVTWLGFSVSLAAAALLLKGAGGPWWPWTLLASAAIALAGFLDVVDGSMARLSGRATRWGGVLDSTLDRVSDLAIYGAMGVHFALRGDVALSTLAWLALSLGFLIAYLRSRAEVLSSHAAIGFWQRTERNTTLGIAAALVHVPTALWILGTVPIFTAWRRWRQVSAILRDAPDPEGKRWSAWLYPWREPRGSVAYTALCVAIVALLFLTAWAPWP